MERRDAAASARPAPATIDLGAPEPPPVPPTSADIARTAPEAATRIEAKVEAKIEPADKARESRAAKHHPQVKIDPPKPRCPASRRRQPAAPAGRGDVRTARGRRRPQPPSISAEPEPPPRRRPRPTSRAPMPMAWPASTVDQVKAIQRLLRDLNFSRDRARRHLRSGHARRHRRLRAHGGPGPDRRAQQGAVRIAEGHAQHNAAQVAALTVRSINDPACRHQRRWRRCAARCAASGEL